MTKLFPLGDHALLASFETESAAAGFAAAARAIQPDGWLDIVPAYFTVAVHFDPDRTTIDAVAESMRSLAIVPALTVEPRRHVIPCCYEMGPDLPRVAQFTGQSPERIIELHQSHEYAVYAVGFCPGFAYLGYLPPELSDVPRLESPRLRVEPGSVGLTGRQTGVYPLARPGGWNLIGRTPLVLVDVADGFFPLTVGDRVRFRVIGRTEFHDLLGQRLPSTQ